MLLVTTENIAGKRYLPLGIARGNVVKPKIEIEYEYTKWTGKNFEAYTDVLIKARHIATKRMIDDALSIGADAIVCVKYGSTVVSGNSTEIIAYGTAVKYTD